MQFCGHGAENGRAFCGLDGLIAKFCKVAANGRAAEQQPGSSLKIIDAASVAAGLVDFESLKKERPRFSPRNCIRCGSPENWLRARAMIGSSIPKKSAAVPAQAAFERLCRPRIASCGTIN